MKGHESAEVVQLKRYKSELQTASESARILIQKARTQMKETETAEQLRIKLKESEDQKSSLLSEINQNKGQLARLYEDKSIPELRSQIDDLKKVVEQLNAQNKTETAKLRAESRAEVELTRQENSSLRYAVESRNEFIKKYQKELEAKNKELDKLRDGIEKSKQQAEASAVAKSQAQEHLENELKTSNRKVHDLTKRMREFHGKYNKDLSDTAKAWGDRVASKDLIIYKMNQRLENWDSEVQLATYESTRSLQKNLKENNKLLQEANNKIEDYRKLDVEIIALRNLEEKYRVASEQISTLQIEIEALKRQNQKFKAEIELWAKSGKDVIFSLESLNDLLKKSSSNKRRQDGYSRNSKKQKINPPSFSDSSAPPSSFPSEESDTSMSDHTTPVNRSVNDKNEKKNFDSEDCSPGKIKAHCIEHARLVTEWIAEFKLNESRSAAVAAEIEILNSRIEQNNNLLDSRDMAIDDLKIKLEAEKEQVVELTADLKVLKDCSAITNSLLRQKIENKVEKKESEINISDNKIEENENLETRIQDNNELNKNISPSLIASMNLANTLKEELNNRDFRISELQTECDELSSTKMHLEEELYLRTKKFDKLVSENESLLKLKRMSSENDLKIQKLQTENINLRTERKELMTDLENLQKKMQSEIQLKRISSELIKKDENSKLLFNDTSSINIVSNVQVEYLRKERDAARIKLDNLKTFYLQESLVMRGLIDIIFGWYFRIQYSENQVLLFLKSKYSTDKTASLIFAASEFNLLSFLCAHPIVGPKLKPIVDAQDKDKDKDKQLLSPPTDFLRHRGEEDGIEICTSGRNRDEKLNESKELKNNKKGDEFDFEIELHGSYATKWERNDSWKSQFENVKANKCYPLLLSFLTLEESRAALRHKHQINVQ